MVNRALAQAQRLASIRSGPGASRLPVEYSRLRLSFAARNANGHMGPRKFAQAYLPQLSFHNPALRIDVLRTPFDKDDDPKNLTRAATLEVYAGSETKPTIEIDVKGLHSDEILKRLLDRTGAVPVVVEEAANLVTTATTKADVATAAAA